MTRAPGRAGTVLAWCAAGIFVSCATAPRSGTATDPEDEAGRGTLPPAGAGSGGESGASGSSGKSSLQALLPARVRRLANAEYDASVQALLGTGQSPATGPDFPPDLRQDGFTVDDAQRVDAVIVERLADVADALATEAQDNGTLAELAPCDSMSDPEGCAESFVRAFGARVYRRPLVEEEVQALLALYAVGADGASYADGIAHVLRGLLQSAGFLYLTELGDQPHPGVDPVAVELTPYEIAASLSYLLTSAPPDPTLLQGAVSGALSAPAEREAQARRLLATDPLAQDTVVRLVREWLGIDRIDESAKDSVVYPEFAGEKSKIVAESTEFVRAVAFRSTGTVSELLGATWTVSSGPLSLYASYGEGPIDGSTELTDRVGILNQAAFVATYGNANESHPIFRGVAVARRVACVNLDSPASFNIEVVPPAPDPSLTTRERYSLHAQDSICTGCHDTIDPLGFSFEHFDGMGAYREKDNGKSVDSAVVVSIPAELGGAYADSNELAAALAGSDTARECFARFMFRAAAATGDQAATPGEAEFIDFWRSLPDAAQGSLVEALIAYVTRPSFTERLAL